MNNESREKIKSEALSFLKAHKVAILSTSKDNEPHAAAIYYLVNDDFTLSFVTSPSTKKAEQLRENSKVAIVVGAGPEINTMQGGGSVIEDPEHKLKTFEKILEQLSEVELHFWPLNKLNPEDLACYKIKLSWLSWLNLDFANMPAGVYNENSQSIISVKSLTL